MRTRKLILGSWRSDVAGTEFWFPMLVGCGCKSRWSVILGFDWRNQPSFSGQGSESEMADLFYLSALCDIASSFTPASSLIECIFSSTRMFNFDACPVVGLRAPISLRSSLEASASVSTRILFTDDPSDQLWNSGMIVLLTHAPKHCFRFSLNPSFHAQVKHTSTRTSKVFPKDNLTTQTT